MDGWDWELSLPLFPWRSHLALWILYIHFLWAPKCIYFSKKKNLYILPILPPMSLVILHSGENFLLNIQNQTLVFHIQNPRMAPHHIYNKMRLLRKAYQVLLSLNCLSESIFKDFLSGPLVPVTWTWNKNRSFLLGAGYLLFPPEEYSSTGLSMY